MSHLKISVRYLVYGDKCVFLKTIVVEAHSNKTDRNIRMFRA